MSGGTIAELLAGIRRDLSYQQSKITDLHAELERRGLLDAPVTRATINGPVTAPACPDCGCAQHTADCPHATDYTTPGYTTLAPDELEPNA